MKLNLGSGLDIKKGWVNVDLDKRNGADVEHDLEKFPYPFKDNSVDKILMDNSLEHLEYTIAVMRELHRICKNGSQWGVRLFVFLCRNITSTLLDGNLEVQINFGIHITNDQFRVQHLKTGNKFLEITSGKLLLSRN